VSRVQHSSYDVSSHAHITELDINFSHIRDKSMTVLNPFRRVDERIMDDADLAGPLIFCFCFATFLLFVRVVLPACLRMVSRTRSPKCAQSGKPQFGYIYGLALLGSIGLYCLLNMMSEQGIDAHRVLSVLGYCLLPMVGVGALSVLITLEYVNTLVAVSLF
jgi:hypothetical protein